MSRGIVTVSDRAVIVSGGPLQLSGCMVVGISVRALSHPGVAPRCSRRTPRSAEAGFQDHQAPAHDHDHPLRSTGITPLQHYKETGPPLAGSGCECHVVAKLSVPPTFSPTGILSPPSGNSLALYTISRREAGP